MANTKSQCNAGQKSNYFESGMLMDAFLSNAIAMLQTRRALTTNSAEALSIGVQIPALQAQQAKIRADMAAFSAGNSAINPPSDAQVATIQAQSTALDGMTAAGDDANAILTVVNTALGVWNTTRV